MSDWRDEEYERWRREAESLANDNQRREKIEREGHQFFQTTSLLAQAEVEATNRDGRFPCVLKYEAVNVSSFYLWEQGKYQRTKVEHNTYPQSVEIADCKVVGAHETRLGEPQKLSLDLCADGAVGVRAGNGECMHERQLAIQLGSVDIVSAAR